MENKYLCALAQYFNYETDGNIIFIITTFYKSFPVFFVSAYKALCVCMPYIREYSRLKMESDSITVNKRGNLTSDKRYNYII